MDALDLIPIVSGLGETARAIKTVDRIADTADDIHDTAKAVDKTTDSLKAAGSVGSSTKKIEVPLKKIHGNSLSCDRTNYGYALIKKDGTIQKFGETVNPKTRYSKSYLEQNGLEMRILESGNKRDIYLWQHDLNEYYRNKYGVYPPLNKKGW